MDLRTVNSYDARASEFAARYGAADRSELQRALLKYLPAAARVLEIGCGCGRDALFLAEHGFRVVATDASAGMLNAFRQSAGERICIADYPAAAMSYMPVVHILQATFPLPPQHELLADKFDAIVATAVVMHLPDAELFEFCYQLRQLLKPGGTVVLSVSDGRAVDAASRDEHGRLYRDRPPSELTLLFERLGFVLLAREKSADAMGRHDVQWTTLVLRLDLVSGTRPVDQIETIINRDRKTATYKLALLRALCDIAQTASQHVQWHPDDTVSVPLGLVAELWLYAYWPLLEANIRQMRGNGNLAFAPAMKRLLAEFAPVGGLDAFHGAYTRRQLSDRQQAALDVTLNRIAAAIVDGPVTHAGGALDAAERFFTHEGPKTARGRCRDSRTLLSSLGRVRFRAEIWRELTLVGHWIGEAILLRWAELTHEITGPSVPVAVVLEKLLTRPTLEREVNRVRGIYASLPGLVCVWTGNPLKPSGTSPDSLALDHVIPFSLWHNNELWNILPAARSINSAKSDLIVERAAMRASEERVIGCWQELRRQEPDRFDLEVGRTLLGRNAVERQWERPAFEALLNAAELVAVQRGVPRWQPAGRPAARRRPAAVPRPPAPREPASALRPISFSDLASDEPFQTALPLVADLAAGPLAAGFASAAIDAWSEFDWIRVPPRLAKPGRFVVRVTGDSMEPLLHIGDLAVFEYHRNPRRDGEIVIVADFADGSDSGVSAIKRYRADASPSWRFTSDNPSRPGLSLPRTDTAHPILGTLVEVLRTPAPL